MHATSFQNLQGTCTPPEAACPGSSRPVACPRQVWPGTGFLRNPGVTPAPEAAGTKTRDGIKDRLWAQLLFLGDSATWELQRLPLWEGQRVRAKATAATRPSPSTQGPAAHCGLWEKYLRALAVPHPPVYPLARQGETGLGGGNSRSLFTYLMFGALQSKILLNECATCEQREVSVAMQGRLGCQCGSEHPGMQTFCLYPDNLRPSLHPETPPGPLLQVSHPGPPHSRTNSTLTCPLPHALLFMATPAPASCTSVRRGPCSASTHDCWAADNWRVEGVSGCRASACTW